MSIRSSVADTALARYFGDVEPCRVEVLQRIQHVGGTRPGWRGSSRAKAMGVGEDLLVLIPWLVDVFDKRDGFEATSVHGGEAEHTGADASDFQHVSDEVPEDAMASLQPCPTERRNAHHISSLAFSKDTELWLQLAPAIQGYASTVEARDSCKQHGLQVTRGISAIALHGARGAPRTNFS